MTSAPSIRIEFEHNTELYPSEDYLKCVPHVASVLRHAELWEAFRRYDDIANTRQKSFRRVATLSIVLGSFGLLCVLLNLSTEAFGVRGHDSLSGASDAAHGHWLEDVLLAGEGAALISILLALWPRTQRLRREWLTARFMTERIRQWHFQLLLDGSLLRRAKRDPRAFEEERAKRWARFMSSAPTAEGGASAFLEGHASGMAHPVSEGGDASLEAEIVRAYVDLRFDKQQAYFQLKSEQYRVRERSTEAIATWALGTALLLSGSQIVFLFVAPWPRHEAPPMLGTALATAAATLAVISLLVHVYRNAHGIPEHRERYESCFSRLVALRAAFDSAQSMSAKRALMEEVEVMLVEELRAFMRQMREASFLL